MEFFIGLDLGQSADFTALVVVERIRPASRPAEYHVRHIERFPLGTSYPAVVDRVKVVANTPPLDDVLVVTDKTGVGAPVCDLLSAAGLRVLPVTITGGKVATQEKGEYFVPKRDLVSNLQVLLQAGRLRFADGLPQVQVLVQELLSFQVKITAAANDTYGAWREGQHDDLVLSLALVTWILGAGGDGLVSLGSDGN